MKPIPPFGLRLFARLALLCATSLPMTAGAAVFNWDPASTGTTSGSGDGTWNDSSTLWYSGGTAAAWVNAGTSEAVFGGTAPVDPDPSHAVALGSPITANKITFDTTGYIISGTTTNNLTFAGTTPSVVANVSGTISAPISLTSALTITGDGGTDTATLSGRISGSGGSIIANSGARLSLSSTNGNDFDGGVTVNSGGHVTVRANSTGNNLGTGSLTLNGGTFATAYNGNGSGLTLTNTKANVIVTANSTFTVNRNNANSNNTIEMNNLSIGTNTLTVTAGNSYSLSFAGTTTLSGNATFTLANTVGSATKYGLALGDVGQTGGTRNITKTGTGTMAINGTATYTGTTTVSAGGFYINGDASAATGAIAINGAATVFGGTGTVGALSTTISGVHAPGALNAIGTQTFSNLLTYAAGSAFAWQIDAGAADPGVAVANAGSYDRVIANGGIGGPGTSTFRISLAAGAFTDAFWDTDKSWDNIISGTPALSSVFNAFGGDVASDGTVAGRGQFSFSGSQLVWTAVPEPSFALALPAFSISLLRRRRK